MLNTFTALATITLNIPDPWCRGAAETRREAVGRTAGKWLTMPILAPRCLLPVLHAHAWCSRLTRISWVEWWLTLETST